MAAKPRRVVTDSMFGLEMPSIDSWSERVAVVLGQNPGPFTGPGTNTYLVGTGAARVLLDTGQGVAGYIPLLERGLRETPGGERIQEIVLTHAHPDHLGGVPSVLERWGPVKVSKKPWPELDRDVEIDAIDDGALIHTEGASLQALWTPGHARDHLCFYMEEEKALFTGDVVLGAGTTVIPRDGDLGDYLASLRRLLELDLDVIYPAHGPAIADPYAKIRDYLAHRALRDEQILEGLSAGIETVAALVERIYVDIPEFMHPAAAVSVEAHLRKLQKEVAVVRDGDRWALA